MTTQEIRIECINFAIKYLGVLSDMGYAADGTLIEEAQNIYDFIVDTH